MTLPVLQSGFCYSSQHPKKNKQLGFTLVELVVTVAIIAILITLSVPAFISFIKSWEAKKTRQKIITTLNTAKAESVINHQNIIVCPAHSTYLCDKNATDLLLVFTDNDGNNRFDTAANRLIMELPLNLNHGKIHLRAGNRHHIKFFGDTGLPRGHFGHIKYCPTHKEAKYMYQVSFNQQGVIRVKPKALHPTNCP